MTDGSMSLTTSLFMPQLPEHCCPTNQFLEIISSYTHTCVPTPQAFTSSLLGSLSILSWLFAQLPQIIRNYQNQSTAGLSLSFLVEWNLGDLSNLFGALLTNQAAWQVIIGAYYVFVDVCLVCQWMWYEWLRHGRPLRRMKLIRRGEQPSPSSSSTTVRVRLLNDGRCMTGTASHTDPQDIPSSKSSHAHNMFSTPIYGTISPSTSLAASPANRTIHRIQQQTLPSASPRAVLLVAMMLAIATARGSPLAASRESTSTSESQLAFDLGTALSWTSTLLYLLSRLPQLIMNYRRKSTAGLSPKMFAAAFLGNLFYSSSLAVNPCAWHSFEAYGGGGWAGPRGSDRHEWVMAALPFFLGAAGVLGLDGAVGVQFWLYGEGNKDDDDPVVLIHESHRSGGTERSVHIRRVTGWMRGWQPSTSGRITPVVNLKIGRAEETQPLLARDGQSSSGDVSRTDNEASGASPP